MKIKRFFKECHKKEVFRKLSIYIVSSWVILQVLAVTWQPIGLPEKSVTYLIIILILGFPLNIYFIWKYRLAPKNEEYLEFTETEKKRSKAFQNMYFSILGFLTLLAIFSVALIVNKNFINERELPEILLSDKIAVLEFGNNTGDNKYDVVGKMTSDWIIHGITENQVAQVISQEIVNDYKVIFNAGASQSNEKDILQEYFKPNRVISGNFYVKDDKLLFQCSVINGLDYMTLISFKPVECDSDNPLICIEELKQLVLGYIIKEDKEILNLVDLPANFDAYQKVLEALSNYSDKELYIDLLNQAIAIDSNYFEPKTHRIAFYYNEGEYQKADSLRKAIVPNSGISKRQKNLLNLYEALLLGDNDRAYYCMKKEYDIAPFDLQSSASTMILALQYVNLPLEVDKIYESISMEEIDIENCLFCEFRIYIKGLADLELKNYSDVIELLKPVTITNEDFYLKKPLIAAYIRSGLIDDLDKMAENLKLSSSEKDLESFYIYASKELLLVNNKEKADDYLGKLLNKKNELNKSKLAEVYYLAGNYNEAAHQYSELHNENSESINYITKLSSSLYKIGEIEESENYISKLDALRTDFQFGDIDYGLAQYYSVRGDKERVFDYLLKSVADGQKYTPSLFQNDQHFKDYIETKEFKEIMNYWH